MNNYFKSVDNILNSDYINGLLLSDAGITTHKNGKTGSLYQFCKHREWLEKIQFNLDLIGIESKIDNGKNYFNKKYNIKSFGYRLQTNYYLEFKELRNIWYKEWYDDPSDESNFRYVKKVPKEIKLSPECIANWYLGDGGIYKFKGCNSFYIYLATNGLIRSDVILLSNKLKEELGIFSYITKNNQIQFGNKNNIIKFLDYIYDYYICCYSYKFPEVC